MSAMPWFFVLACYKLGILLEGTHARAVRGPGAEGDRRHAPQDGHVAVPEGCADDRRVIQRGPTHRSRVASRETPRSNRGYRIVPVRRQARAGGRVAPPAWARRSPTRQRRRGRGRGDGLRGRGAPGAQGDQGRPARPASIDTALDECGGPVHALFSCAGVADGTPGIEKINFIGHRHMIDRLLAAGSAGGRGHRHHLVGGRLGWEANLVRSTSTSTRPTSNRPRRGSRRTTRHRQLLWSKQAIGAYIARRPSAPPAGRPDQRDPARPDRHAARPGQRRHVARRSAPTTARPPASRTLAEELGNQSCSSTAMPPAASAG